MPQLNPEAGVPAVELVGPGTNREELLEIYLEVYKLHWLPGSPPGEPAIAQEVLAAVPDCPERREEVPEAQTQLSPGDSHPSKSRRPHLLHNFGGRNRKAKPNEDTFTVGGEIKELGSPEV